MEQLFISILNMSLTGSVIIAAMLVVRLCFRRAPRIFSYALWAVVLFRLLCPVSFSSSISFLGILAEEAAKEGRMEYIPADIGLQMEPKLSLPVPGINEAVNESLPPGNPAGSVNPLQIVLFMGAWIWVLGMAAMLIHSGLSLFSLKRKLKGAVWERENIYRMPGQGTPFVYGVFRPRIYLSEALTSEEERYILLHEQIHIRRRDPLFRTLAYLALCLHWFNPLVWLAFSLSEKDMEMSCDEAVIREAGDNIKKNYSASLLALASGRRIIKGIPLAFGEGDTKKRIENVLYYQKPARILAVTAAVVCVILAVQFLACPKDKESTFYGIIRHEDAEGEALSLLPLFDDAKIPEAEEAQTQYPSMAEAEIPYLSLADLRSQNGLNGTYYVNMISLSRSAWGIDRYVTEEVAEEELPFLAFAKDCVFEVNQSMNSVSYVETSFDDFAALSEAGRDWINPLCVLRFEDNLITRASLGSAWYGYGVKYEPFVRDGSEPLESRYTLIRTEAADFGTEYGLETAEIYTGNTEESDSGFVLFKNAEGEILYSESAEGSRAGWNNIYLGEMDGQAFLMTLHVEDRDNYGSYSYQVFRLGAGGMIYQICGSSLEFDEDLIPWDEDVYRMWAEPMLSYLEAGHLLLSTQDGEVRTEAVSDSGKYSYEALRKDF